MVAASIPIFALWISLTLGTSDYGHHIPTWAQTAFLVLFLCVPVAMVVLGMGWTDSYPQNLRIDSAGATLDWRGGKNRTLLWTNAYSWFELLYMPPAQQRKGTLTSSRYYMAGPSGLVTSMFPIPEPAFVRLLDGAREAGVAIDESIRPGGSHFYFVKGRRAL